MPQQYLVFGVDDPVFTIVEENQSHATMANVKRKDIVGKSLQQAFPDTSERYLKTGESDFMDSLRRVIKSGQPDTMETLRYDLKRPDGTFEVRYFKLVHYPLFDDQKKVQFVFQVTRDITKETVAGTKLEQVQRQLKDALSVGLVGTWTWDMTANIVVGDENLAHMFGVDVETAAQGIPIEIFTNCIHPSDRPKVEKAISKTVKSHAPYEQEYRTVNKTGDVSWVIARGKVEADAQGNYTRFPGVIVDITERKRAEYNLVYLSKVSAILSASLKYKKALQAVAKLSVPEIATWCTIDIVDSQGKKTQVVVAHEDPSKVAWAKELDDSQYKYDPEAKTGIANVIRTGKPEFYPEIPDEMLVQSAKSEAELSLFRGLGMNSVIIVPLRNGSETIGTLTLILAHQTRRYDQKHFELAQEIATRASLAITNSHLYESAKREIAERDRLQNELFLANAELEKRVTKRTAQLEASNINLERSNQELESFAYVASHDLQEPLRKIQAFGDLLESEYGEQLSSGKDYLQRMRSAAKRMSILIEDLLSFSRVTTTGHSFSKVNLNLIVAEVLEDLETRINSTGGKIELATLPVITADPTQMRQLFQNIIGNALKFHKPGVPPVISIKVKMIEGIPTKSKLYSIAVKDNGVGFDQKYTDRIFSVFQRLHGRGVYEGTGIGLAVCRKIVERHNGTIEAKSKTGIGSIFTITLPLKPIKKEH